MKNKKVRKNNCRAHGGIPYTPGRNMLGDKVETRLVILKRETAYTQMIEALSWVLNGDNREATYDMTCFVGHEDEMERLAKRVQLYITFNASMKGIPLFYHVEAIKDAA